MECVGVKCGMNVVFKYTVCDTSWIPLINLNKDLKLDDLETKVSYWGHVVCTVVDSSITPLPPPIEVSINKTKFLRDGNE